MDVFCTVIDIISVCGSIPIEVPILWPRAVMIGPRPRVLLTLPLILTFGKEIRKHRSHLKTCSRRFIVHVKLFRNVSVGVDIKIPF